MTRFLLTRFLLTRFLLTMFVVVALAGCRAPRSAVPPTTLPTSAPTQPVVTPAQTPAESPVTPTTEATAPEATAPEATAPEVAPENATEIATENTTEISTVDVSTLPAPEWLADAATYRDEIAHFELRYPADWDILDLPLDTKQTSTGYSVTLNSWPRDQGGSQGVPPGGPKVDVSVQKTGAQTPEEAVALIREQYRQEEPPIPILSEQQWLLSDGARAVRLEVEGRFERAVVLITANGGYTINLAALGDFARTDEIARTLRLVE